VPIDAGSPLPTAPLAEAFGGAPVDLAGLAAGGPALLFLYKSDCPATEVAAPVLPRFAAVPGLALVAISQDGPEEARRHAEGAGWPGPVRTLVDAEPWPASVALGARVTPTWILVATGGRVVRTAEGWAREDVNGLAAAAAGLATAAAGLATAAAGQECSPAPVISAAGGAEPPWRPG